VEFLYWTKVTQQRASVAANFRISLGVFSDPRLQRHRIRTEFRTKGRCHRKTNSLSREKKAIENYTQDRDMAFRFSSLNSVFCISVIKICRIPMLCGIGLEHWINAEAHPILASAAALVILKSERVDHKPPKSAWQRPIMLTLQRKGDDFRRPQKPRMFQ